MLDVPVPIIEQPILLPNTSAASITPRVYQQEAIDAVVEHWAAGIRNALVVLPTGCGKTIVFASLLKQQLQPRQRALVLAHTDELIRQPRAKLAQVWPEANVGIAKRDTMQVDRQIICGSVQTLARPKRLAQLLSAGSIDLVIVDEAHHAVAPQYRTILKALKERNPLLCHLGVTATPNRADGKGLIVVYEALAYRKNIKWATEEGYLVPAVGRAIDGVLSLQQVELDENGDYKEAQLISVLDARNWCDHILDTWHAHAEGRPTIAFTVSVPAAKLLADRYNRDGIPAAYVYGEMDAEARRNLLAAYSAGTIKVLCNYGVLTEGFDHPATSCIIMARPTQSQSLYIQCVGRGLRPAPDKSDCVVLNFVDEGHTLVQVPDLYGEDDGSSGTSRSSAATVTKDGETLTIEPTNLLGAAFVSDQEDAAKPLIRKTVTRILDLMSETTFAWFEHDGMLSLTLDRNRTLIISPPQAEAGLARYQRMQQLVAEGFEPDDRQQRIIEHMAGAITQWTAYLVMGHRVEVVTQGAVGEVIARCEKEARHSARKWAYDRRSASYGEHATEKQLAFLANLGLTPHAPISKGQAMAALSYALARKTVTTQRWC